VATLLSDTFTDTNGTALASHTMDVGPGWTALSGTWQINASNQATETAQAGVEYHCTSDAGQADVTAQVDVTTPTQGSGNCSCGLYCRGSDQNNGWDVIIERDAGSYFLGIYERVSGTSTLRASTTLSFTVGTTHTIRAVLSGNSITATVDGANTTSYSPASSNQAVTKFGLENYCDGSNYGPALFDNFLVTGSSTPPVGKVVEANQAVTNAATF